MARFRLNPTDDEKHSTSNSITFSNPRFHTAGDQKLDECLELVEEAIERDEIEEADLNDGVLKIEFVDTKSGAKQNIVINKHQATKQVW